ncbi:beta-N-acetylglucosaminidase domain-containing protein [Streptomyces sp. M41]|uniref:beta-N-acetylglucosaminidase domain-containing protein n=1 Tax=Streptomyces sp. M41 TaxID=3059412 RepID=UPI00374DF66B
MSSSRSPLSALITVTVTSVALMLSPAAPSSAADAPPAPHASSRSRAATTLPIVHPVPRSLVHAGDDVSVTRRVVLVSDEDTDAPAAARLREVLEEHGAASIDVVEPDRDATFPEGALTVLLGPASRPDIARVLHRTNAPARPESYALRVTGSKHGPGVVTLAGHDTAGQFYAVQTLRQLLRPSREGAWQIAGVRVDDHPAMALRGTIEGFYGQPWTHKERLDQMAFYGDVKANTYIYAPKDDPYHRSKWRDPYPADKLAELGTLVRKAADNHVHFTFAVSPGESICYSDPADRNALKNKLQALYDLGTRAFSIPLDDISYTRWNCAGDRSVYGEPGSRTAAAAQVDLLNDVQQNFISTHEGARPLQTVPTEYGDLKDTAYKQEIRASLDPTVVVMWTGTDVVPPSITNAQADAASALFGRKVFVWDNYPVNDFGNTSGRLLLAPYAKREAGLSDHLSGIVANPMNQPYASKIAVFGAASFAWNDRAYRADQNWAGAMSYLAGGKRRAADALTVFADLEHLAPTFGSTPWQSQAPRLASRISAFWAAWDHGDRKQALKSMRAYARAITHAPVTIRSGTVQPGFVVDADDWLDATRLWGGATVKMLAALAARECGDKDRAETLAAAARALRDEAKALRTSPGRNTWGEVQPKVGDGVLDTFLAQADARLTGGTWGEGLIP